MRYSEQRLQDDFVVHLLMKGPFRITSEALVSSIKQEFPSLNEWTDVMPLVGIQSDCVVGIGAIVPKNSDGHSVTVIYHQGNRAPSEHYQTAVGRAADFPQAQQVLQVHDTYVSFSVKSKSTNLADRYKAARALTCLTAVAARHSNCIGVLFPSGDIIASPEQWYQAAQQTQTNNWPIFRWISFQPARVINNAGQPEWSCGSVGLAAFLGHEMAFPAAPVAPDIPARYVYGAIYLQLERGNRFKDSDTLSVEEGAETLRVRFMAEGSMAQTDTYVLLHPTCSVNELEVFGERTVPPPPPGVDNKVRGYKDFMDDILNANDITHFG